MARYLLVQIQSTSPCHARCYHKKRLACNFIILILLPILCCTLQVNEGVGECQLVVSKITNNCASLYFMTLNVLRVAMPICLPAVLFLHFKIVSPFLRPFKFLGQWTQLTMRWTSCCAAAGHWMLGNLI